MLKEILLVNLLLIPIIGLAENNKDTSKVELSDDNASVSFKVDSTWHMIHGKTSSISGYFHIKDTRVVDGLLVIPVKNFDTDNGSRDERLREVMSEPQFHEVNFKINSSDPVCTITEVDLGDKCEGKLKGDLTIKDVTKYVEIPFSMSKREDRYIIQGDIILRWADYGVEDPSILVARLDPEVKVSYALNLDGDNLK